MEYTIQKMAALSGVSPRTLRYYDEIGLLRPGRVTHAGYRVYGEEQVDRLQQILFYKAMGLRLSSIARILEDPSFHRLDALRGHLKVLEGQRSQLELLIKNVTKTIQKEEGMLSMTAEEKFEGLKRELLQKNEQAYGQEIRKAYGNEAVEQSNRNFTGLSGAQYEKMKSIGEELNTLLEDAVRSGKPADGPQGRRAFSLHREWLGFTLPGYTPIVHLGLVSMYVSDARFTAYYDRNVPGCAAFLRDAVNAVLGAQE